MQHTALVAQTGTWLLTSATSTMFSLTMIPESLRLAQGVDLGISQLPSSTRPVALCLTGRALLLV